MNNCVYICVYLIPSPATYFLLCDAVITFAEKKQKSFD